MIDHMTVDAEGTCLNLIWEGGAQSQLSATTLRREARDAQSIRQRIDHNDIYVAPDLRITALQKVGSVGLNVHFSDGHMRAIYPYSYLKELSERFDK